MGDDSWDEAVEEAHAYLEEHKAVGRCILCGPVDTGMWAHFNSDAHQSMVLLNMQVEIALPAELRR